MSHRIASIVVAWLAVAIVSVPAQGPESRADSSANSERITIAEHAFSIQLAKGWSGGEPIAGAFLVLVGEEKPGEFRPNLNVRANSGMSIVDRAALRDGLMAQYPKIFRSWAATGDGDVEIAGKPSAWFSGRHEQGGHELQMLQYFVPGKPKSIVATFICTRDRFAELEPAFRAMAASIRWKPGSAGAPEPAKAVIDAEQRVSIAGHKISLVAPAGWEISPMQMGALFIVLGEQVGEFRTNVCVTSNGLAKRMKPSEAAAAVANELKQMVGSYEAAGSGEIQIAGQRECWVSSRFTQGKERLRNIQYFVTGAPESFVVTFTTLDSHFDKLKKTFEETARSIALD